MKNDSDWWLKWMIKVKIQIEFVWCIDYVYIEVYTENIFFIDDRWTLFYIFWFTFSADPNQHFGWMSQCEWNPLADYFFWRAIF